MIISTPELLANLVETPARLSRDVVSRIAFVVVDEFDEFLLFEYDQRGPSARFDLVFESLRSVLPAKSRPWW